MAWDKVVLDGEKIRRLRERRGLSSQGDLARAAALVDPKRGGLAPRTVWDAENGKPVTRRTQLLVARVLEVADPEELLVAQRQHAAENAPGARTPRFGWIMVAAGAVLAVFSAGSLLLWPHLQGPAPGQAGSRIGLDTAVWTVNGPAARAALANMDVPRAQIVQPTLSFSPALGLGMTGINGTYEQAGIQTVTPFRPPFTVSATVMAAEVTAGVFQLVVTSADGGRGVSLAGGQGANDVFTGLDLQSPSGAGTHWKLKGKLSEPRAPSLNVWYQLAITVDGSGTATVSAGPQGAQPRRGSIPALGTGPFYVLLSQGSGAYGHGPNRAYWRSVTISRRDAVTALRLWRDAPLAPARDAVALRSRSDR